MKTDKFNVNIFIVVLSTNIPKNKKYVLSTNNKELKLPVFSLSHQDNHSIDSSILNFLQNKIVASPLELRPTLLSVNSPNFPNGILVEESINLLYGSVIPFNENINNVYWQEFDFLLPHPYSNLLFEVVHTLS